MSYLDQIAARIARSTTGPWETRINDLTDEVTVVHDSEAVLQVAWIDGDYRHTWAMPDAEFIANARVDVPRLLVATYQAANNWSTLAARIKPSSELP